MKTYRKRRKSHKRRKTRRVRLNRMRGGNLPMHSINSTPNFRAAWVGIPNPDQPAGFGWLNQTFLFPCKSS